LLEHGPCKRNDFGGEGHGEERYGGRKKKEIRDSPKEWVRVVKKGGAPGNHVQVLEGKYECLVGIPSGKNIAA